jgi:flagellar protein FliO/FliZ
MNAAPATALPAGSLLQLTLSLTLVVALIFVVTWLVKRFNLATPRASRTMSVIDEIALTPRERVVLVQVGNAQVLVGVGVNGLTALAPLATPIEVPPTTGGTSFAERLREFMHRPGAST